MMKICFYLSITVALVASVIGESGLAIAFVIFGWAFNYLREETVKIPVPNEMYEILKILSEKEGMTVSKYAEKILKEDREERDSA